MELGHTDDTGLIANHWNPKPGDTCIDVGTGPGAWTVTAVSKGAICYGLTPDLDNLRETAMYLIKNNLVGGVLLPLAMWSHTGKSCLDRSVAGGRLARENSQPIGEGEEVPTITMDDLVERFNIQNLTHVNLDAEWAEVQILQHAQETLKRFGPKIIVEVHPGNSAQEVVNLLKQARPDYIFDSTSSFVIAHTGES